MTADRTITITPGDDQPGHHHTDPTGTIAHTGPAAGCTLPGCEQTPDTDAQAARWARREPLAVLLSRMQRGVLLPQERDLLRAAVQTELADGDQAREQLGAAEQRLKNRSTLHAAAFSAHDMTACTALLYAAEQDAREARRGEAEAVRAREAAEDRATLAETARDVVMARLPRLYAQLTKALRLPPSVQWDDIATAAADCYDRAERAEATLTAVRKAVAEAKACGGEDTGCTVDHRDIITAILDNGLAALGDPRPATEPTPAVCCVCGCPDVTYRNCNDQPFCCRCAMCCDPPKPCTHGCQPPTCPAQNTATPDRVAHCDLPAHHDEDHRDSTVPGVLRWTDDVAVYPATAEPKPPAPALPVVTCGPITTHAAHQYMTGRTVYQCPGLTVTDLREQAAPAPVFTLFDGAKPAEPLRTPVIDAAAREIVNAAWRVLFGRR